jgi:hypothetical protein
MPDSSPPRSAAQHAPARQSAALAQAPSGAGALELLRDAGGRIRIRILDGTGAVLALSPDYPDTAAVLEGVEALREYAATSHVSDQTGPHPEATRPRPHGRSVNGSLPRGGAGSLPGQDLPAPSPFLALQRVKDAGAAEPGLVAGLSGALHPRPVAGSPAPLPTQGVSVEVA